MVLKGLGLGHMGFIEFGAALAVPKALGCKAFWA